MTVMVDDLQSCAPFSPKGQAARVFAKDKFFCHMTTDGDISELHTMAERIGMKRTWFQDHPLMPHYDLTPGRREAALMLGAVFVSAMVQARARRARRMLP